MARVIVIDGPTLIMNVYWKFVILIYIYIPPTTAPSAGLAKSGGDGRQNNIFFARSAGLAAVSFYKKKYVNLRVQQ